MKYSVISGITLAIAMSFGSVSDVSAQDRLNSVRRSPAVKTPVHVDRTVVKTAGLLDLFRPSKRYPTRSYRPTYQSNFKYRSNASSYRSSPYSPYSSRTRTSRPYSYSSPRSSYPSRIAPSYYYGR